MSQSEQDHNRDRIQARRDRMDERHKQSSQHMQWSADGDYTTTGDDVTFGKNPVKALLFKGLFFASIIPLAFLLKWLIEPHL